MPPFRLRYRSTHLELASGDFSVGRSSKCNLSISDELVSRKHAVFHVGTEAVSLEDLSSCNGVVVNGAVVSGRCRLTHLDRIFIGQEEFVLIDAAKVTDSAKPAPIGNALELAEGLRDRAAEYGPGERLLVSRLDGLAEIILACREA